MSLPVNSSIEPTMEPFLRSVYSRANCLHPQAFFVRLDSKCNQKCDFCNILAPGVEFSLNTGYVTAMLRRMASLRSNATVNFTGGEPTLRQDLPKLIRYGKSVGIHRMVLQTNAIRFASESYLEEVMTAGLDDALVSFHSSRPDVSDSLTGAPGTWQKTVKGIENALERGLEITLNVVLTTENLDHLEETIAFALERFPGLHGIILSPLQPHGNLLNHTHLMPRYRDLILPVRAAARRIREADVHLYLSYCENPLCWLLDAFDVEGTVELRGYISRRLRANECGDCHLSTTMDKDKVKPSTCDGCLMDEVCFGVWRSYYELYGEEELSSIERPPGLRSLRKKFSVAPHMSSKAGCGGCGTGAG